MKAQIHIALKSSMAVYSLDLRDWSRILVGRVEEPEEQLPENSLEEENLGLEVAPEM